MTQKKVYTLFVVGLLIFLTSPLSSQNKHVIESYFEGKMVILKIDMPATSRGVEVRLAKTPQVDFTQLGNRLKEYGTAIYAGEESMVTKVKTKGKHIEFQLGGGGYGTFGDESGNVGISTHVPKSRREKDLEKRLKDETNERTKKALKSEIDELRRERRAEERRLRLMKEDAEAAKKDRIRNKALQAGSRFNIRFGRNLTPEDMTPEAIMEALAEYVDFDAAPRADAPSPVADVVETELRKGLLWEEVAQMYGAPSNVSQREDCGFKVTTCEFEKNDQIVKMEFVEGVLVRYTISSN